MQSHDPVMMLSGRQLLMGYWGQLWVSGIAYHGRQSEVEQILTLGPEAERVIRQYGVDYVVIGPDPVQTDHGGVTANLNGFLERYPVVAQAGGYLVFDVRGEAAALPASSSLNASRQVETLGQATPWARRRS
jgi:hypothetical protein